MKANELMIGDFVLSKSDDKICKINSIITQDDGSILVATEDGLQFDYMCDAIPITAEILEKNGFTHSFGDSDYYDYEKWEKKVNDKTIRVIKDHNGWFCRVDDIELTRSMGIAPDVHTMQHIIRIGGIEKEIISGVRLDGGEQGGVGEKDRPEGGAQNPGSAVEWEMMGMC